MIFGCRYKHGRTWAKTWHKVEARSREEALGKMLKGTRYTPQQVQVTEGDPFTRTNPQLKRVTITKTRDGRYKINVGGTTMVTMARGDTREHAERVASAYKHR